MNFSEKEIQITKDSVELIRQRKSTRILYGIETNITSAIVTAWQIFDPNNNHITGVDFIQIAQAIALPNAKIFFLSHDAHKEKDCVEKLADFIEKNSFDSSFLP